MKKKAVFFDRDGVILKAIVMDGRPRPAHSIAEYKALSGVMSGAKETVEKVKAAGFLAFLISNQPDIAYGVISKAEWQWIQDQTSGIPFDDVFICFHRRDDNCDCMKPKPGKLLEAAEKWKVDLSQSFLVGDTKDDALAAKNAGCRSILLDAPYNTEVLSGMRIHSFSELSDILL
ncbi:MAG: HAD-IIIA family hydrolase [Patescibacteria group bacterium]